MTKLQLPIRIDDVSDLEQVASILHDAPFEHDKASYDAASRTFQMILDREGQEDEPRWVQCKLTFRQVEHAEIRTEGLRSSLLIDIEYDSESHTLSFDICPMRIILRVTNLDGELMDTGQPVPDRAHGCGCLTWATAFLYRLFPPD